MPNQWDIRRVLILLTRSWWWPVGIGLASVMAAKLYLRYTTSIYKSDATIQIELERSSLVKSNQGSMGGFISMENIADSYVELFMTYDLVQQAVRELKLDWEVYSLGKVGRSLIFPTPFWIEAADTLLINGQNFWGLFPIEVEIYEGQRDFIIRKNDSVFCKGKVGEWVECGNGKLRITSAREDGSFPFGDFLIERQPERIAISSWQRKVSVTPKRGLTAWLISVTDISPSRAQSFLQKLLEHAREYERGLRQVYYQKAIQYIDTLLLVVKEDLDKAHDSLFRKEQKTDMPFVETRRERAIELFSQIDAQKLGKPEEEALQALEAQLSRLLKELQGSPEAVLYPISVLPSTPTELRPVIESINQLIERRELLMQRYTPTSPPLLSLRQTLLKNLQHLEYLISELRRLNAEQLRKQRQEWIQKRKQIYEDIFSKRQFSLQEEDVILRQSIYKSLLEKKIEYSIEKEAISSAIRITQPPTFIAAPISPNPIQVYVIGIFLGIVIGVGGVLLWHLINQKVSYRSDIEGLSPIPVIGELPYAKGQKGVFPFSRLQIEVLRSLRSALGFLWEENSPRVLIVTSTVSGEGKSFVARGMAYAYALSGYRVLLIDTDLRRATISHEVGVLDKGLSLLLASPSQVSHPEEYIVPMGREGLYFLSSGPIPPNPTELLDSPFLSRLIQSLSDRFDYFVLDTSPIGLVPDTLSVMRNLPSSVTLYVFRAEYSRIPFLKHLEEMIKIHRLQKVYLLFNGTRLSRPRYGYGYGYGYYGNGYSRRYYGTSTGSPSVWRRIRELLPV
ncbi:MAG: polysaccharide biosynthesis tyrosine autokinase [Bacteroidia bacterium]|nr:polysaccharide biosynthesis tyrosine autokinase [Bacteroidia bacterium]